jgi:hypothetical protein
VIEMTKAHTFLGRHARTGAWGTLAVAALVAMAPMAAAGTATDRAHTVVTSPEAPTERASAIVSAAGGRFVAAHRQVGVVLAGSTETGVAASTSTTKRVAASAGPGALSSPLIPIGMDVVAILLLVFSLYLPRHHRRDLVVAFLGVNVGVMAVSAALLDSAVTAGLGLGLFGVLSIIRLRSDELAQHEVAYYFSALALGLLGGVSVNPLWLGATLMLAILMALWVGDNPRLLPHSRRQLIVLDRAFDQEPAMIAHLEERLGATVQGVTVQKVDHVNDSTWVDVRFRLPKGAGPVPTTAAVPPTSLFAPGQGSETQGSESDSVAAAGLNGHVRGGVG